MNRTIGVKAFRDDAGAIIDAVRNDKQSFVLTNWREPCAVMIAADEYERLLRDQQELERSTRPPHERA